MGVLSAWRLCAALAAVSMSVTNSLLLKPRAPTSRPAVALRRPDFALLARAKSADGPAEMNARQRQAFSDALDDFDNFIECLRFFQEQNGHCRVSTRYVMPGKAPTPETFRKYRLGSRFFALMKGKGLLRDEHTDKFDAMRALGVDFDDDMSEWDRILLALKAYKDIVGGTKVSARYVCPAEDPWPRQVWGFRLGSRVTAIRNTGLHIRDDEDRVRVLDEIGFDWRRTETDESKVEPFDTILEALECYRSVLGDLSVPHSFIVPSVAPWPEKLQGLPLGQRVNAIRAKDLYVKDNADRILALNALGFIWSHREQNVEERFRLVVDALRFYREQNGDANVPQSFKVPRSSPWPEHMWGMQLGNRVNSIRSHGTFIRNRPDRKAELTALGFVRDPPKGLHKGRVLSEDVRGEDAAPSSAAAAAVADAAAAADAASLFGDEAFYADELDEEDAEPRMELWQLADPLRDGRPAEGFRWHYDEVSSRFTFEDVLGALEAFKELAGDVDVPRTFVCGGPESLAEMDEDGAPPAPAADMAALSRPKDALPLAEEGGGALYGDGADGFGGLDGLDGLEGEPEEAAPACAADEAHPLLQRYRGLALGAACERIREGSILARDNAERRSALDALGFAWGAEERYIGVPFNLLVAGLLVYRKVRGNALVPWDFVVPDGAPWPYPVRGLRLGRLVNEMRANKDACRLHHEVKWQTLQELEFMWLPARFEDTAEGAAFPGAEDARHGGTAEDYFVAIEGGSDTDGDGAGQEILRDVEQSQRIGEVEGAGVV